MRYIAQVVIAAVLAALQTFVSADDPIKLHVFLHSHNDLGWIYTFENYYQGTNSQEGGCVKCLLNFVVNSLGRNKNRKYQFAEVAFLKRWLQDQTTASVNEFKKFVENGQFTFVNGAWGSNDEGCAYYEDIIDQFILGHRYLKEHFNVYPTTGWQIDSFGHSKTHAALMAQMGIQGLFFGRIDYQDWETRREKQTLEFNWKPGNPRGESEFTHVLYVHYSDTKFMIPDNFFCRSIFCNGRLQDYQLRTLENWIKQQAASFKTKNVAMLVGDDFHLWREAEKDFDGIEAMVEHFNTNPNIGIQAKFSTLPEYVNEFTRDYLAQHSDTKLPEKKSDFFPYIENAWTAWVGYFTSKSMFKLRVRQMSRYNQLTKLLIHQLSLRDIKGVFGIDSFPEFQVVFNDLDEALGIIQHHDGISATMKEYVREDYDNMMNNGRNQIDQLLTPLMAKYLEYTYKETFHEIVAKYDWLYKDDAVLDMWFKNNIVALNIYNPGEGGKFMIKVRVVSYFLKVIDDYNDLIPADIICHSDDGKSDCFLYFVANIPGYTNKAYKISNSAMSIRVIPTSVKDTPKIAIDRRVEFGVLQDMKTFEYKICPADQPDDIFDFIDEEDCISDLLTIKSQYYESWVGSGLQVSSGAYVFRPRRDERFDYTVPQTGKVFQGRVITQVFIKQDLANTEIHFYHHALDEGFVVDTHYTSCPRQGTEIINIFGSKNIKNDKNEFHTDCNGYLMQERRPNYRDDFNSQPDLTIPNNYYPITSAIYIEDTAKKTRMTVNTDRAQGATSLLPGTIEIMVHRLTLNDDWKGLSEILDEREPGSNERLRVSTRHIVHFSNPLLGLPHQQRAIQYKMDRQPHLWFFITEKEDFPNPKDHTHPETSLQLGENIKFYIRSYQKGEFIIRLHNLNEEERKIIDFNDEFGNNVILSEFAGRSLKYDKIEELTLLTTKLRSELNKNPLDPDWPAFLPEDGENLSYITLLPQEMRTFKITLK